MVNELPYHFILPPSLVFPQTLSLITLSIIISILVTFLKWKQSKSNNSEKLRTIDDLPRVRNFPFWMPQVVEGLATAYYGITGGIHFWTEWWLSLNKPEIFTVPFPYFRCSRLVVVNSPDLIRKILISSDHHMLQRPDFLYNVMWTELTKDSLITAKVSSWELHRKILNQFFVNYKSLPQIFKTINKYTQQFVSNLDKETGAGNDLCSILEENILKIILDLSMGPGAVEEYGVQQFSKHFKKMKLLAAYRMAHPECKLDFMWSLNPKKKEYDECVEYIQRYVSEGISWAKKSMKGNGELSNSCVEQMLKNEMSENEIQVEVTTLLITGDETTDGTIHFLLQQLAENPDIQDKCHNEIKSLFDSKASDELTMDDLSSLKYLERCILELLRIAPTVPLFAREMGEPIELDGVLMEKGTVIIISPWLLHRNPDIYPDSGKYDPDRFLPEEVKQRHHYAFIPFSTGPRNCIGWKMAMMSMKTIVALLLRDYRVKTTDKFADMKLLYEVSLLPERKFDIFVEKR